MKDADQAKAPLLVVRDLSAGFENTTVLSELSFEVRSQGLLALLGPAGVGKSTLLRCLGRYNDLRPSFWVHGSVRLQGRELLQEVEREEAHRQVALLAQKARLFTATVQENAISEVSADQPLSHQEKRLLAQRVLESCELWPRLSSRLSEPVTALSIAEQRMLVVARLLARGAQCILADEPFRDIAAEDISDLVAFFERLKRQCAVIAVTHNQSLARQLADDVCLVTAGRVVETATAQEFFEDPKTDLGKSFLRSGNCWPQQPPEFKTSASSRPTAVERQPRPGGFHWISTGRLAGVRWPGLLGNEQEDLDGLVRLGVKHLISLTEQPYPAERLTALGLNGVHCPIVDMSVPTLQAAHEVTTRASAWMEQGQPVAFHCKAGLGRTGTLLACTLVYRGETALRAIEKTKLVNRLYIQSECQLQFVSDYELFVSKCTV